MVDKWARAIAAGALLVGVIGLGLGVFGAWQAKEALNDSDEALDQSKEALRIAEIGVQVRGDAQAAASLVRSVHEMSLGSDIVWEWYGESTLTIDATFSNHSLGPVSLESVRVENSRGEEIYRKDFSPNQVRVEERGSAPVPIAGDEIELKKFDERLVGTSCTRVPRNDDCQSQQNLEVTGRVIVTPIDGKDVFADFELVIRHESVRSCAPADLSIFAEPTNGCPPEVIPTADDAFQPSPEPTG